MRSGEQERTETAGVSLVKMKFQKIGWGPLDNKDHDLGVDLFVQARDERRFDRNALVGVQVKTGKRKYFRSPQRDDSGKIIGWWFKDHNVRHFDDWVQHGLPHLLVIATLDPNKAYWVHVTADKIVKSGKGCKILVPRSQRIRWKDFDALMAVATSAKSTPDLQGSLYRAGPDTVAPGRALRHALIAPRLIAPRRWLAPDYVLAPEEAIAFITSGRLHEIGEYRRTQRFKADEVAPGEVNKDLLNASETSADWRWRFYYAVHELVTRQDSGPIVRLAEATASGACGALDDNRHAACAVVAAVALMDEERWDDANDVLVRAGSELNPVDHGWVLTHRAVVFAELNDIEQARKTAVEALRALGADRDDVTARAIASAAANVLLSTTGWGEQGPLPGAEGNTAPQATSDTAVSWWRSIELAKALGTNDDGTYESWGCNADLGTDLPSESRNKLTGVWLTCLLSGDRRQSGWPLSLRVRHALQHHDLIWRDTHADQFDVTASLAATHDSASHTAAAATAMESALDELRRYGRNDDLKTAAHRLWRAGPAAPVKAALTRSLAQPWRPTTARTRITLLTECGDLLDRDAADMAARECIAILTDPAVFHQKARPTFSTWHFVPRAIGTLLTAASDDVHAEVLTLTLESLADNGGQGRSDDLRPLVDELRPAIVAARADVVRSVALALGIDGLSAQLLSKLRDSGDSQAIAELTRRAELGDLRAVEALGGVTALSPIAAVTLIGQHVDWCRQTIASASKGVFSRGIDSVRNLTVLNLAFPEQADWDPVLDAIFDPHVVVGDKIASVTILTTASKVPGDVIARLRVNMKDRGSDAIQGFPLFGGTNDELAASAFALAVSIGAIDSAQGLAKVLNWLRGSAVKRRGAQEVVRALGRVADSPLIQGALVTLTGDPQYQVRAAAAGALAHGTRAGSSPAVEQALLAASTEPGCAVPLTVARTLQNSPYAWTDLAEICDRLQSHISARVRQAASNT